MSAICGASRGNYGKPILISESGIRKCIDDEYNEYPFPEKMACDHPDHWKLGSGTRNGQKLYYPVNEMFIQKWEMTEEEMEQAVEAYDMFSLEMKPRILCKNCANHEDSTRH